MRHSTRKTGTAQQSQTHPDHGLFVGFAPSDSPQIAFAIRIANGYSSTFAAEVGNDNSVKVIIAGAIPVDMLLS